jgi:hypothetical protein
VAALSVDIHTTEGQQVLGRDVLRSVRRRAQSGRLFPGPEDALTWLRRQFVRLVGLGRMPGDGPGGDVRGRHLEGADLGAVRQRLAGASVFALLIDFIILLSATQVVVEHLDFDLVASDLAPNRSQIQRAGRLWRHMDRRPQSARAACGSTFVAGAPCA